MAALQKTGRPAGRWLRLPAFLFILTILDPARAAEPDAAARAAIAAHCQRCHPALPGGGWQTMMTRPLTRAQIENQMRRMEEEFSAFPSDAEAAAIVDFLDRNARTRAP